MKFTRILFFGLGLAVFVSCSQDLDVEEYKETVDLIPFRFGVKMVNPDDESSRKNIRSQGEWGYTAFYQWELGDPIGLFSPDSPQGYQKGAYTVSGASDIWLTSTNELTNIPEQGSIAFATEKANDFHRICAGYPAGLVNIIEMLDFVYNKGTEFQSGSCRFTATISSDQKGIVKEDENGTVDYRVGDWTKAICGSVHAEKPINVVRADGEHPVVIPMYPLFTEAEIDFTAPSECKILKVELKGMPIVSGTPINANLCGTATGIFQSTGGLDLSFPEFTTTPGPNCSTTHDNKVSLTVGDGFSLGAGKSMRASLFFFPIGEITTAGTIGEETIMGKRKIKMNTQIGVTYECNGKTLTKVKSYNGLSVVLGGRNHINLGTLPTE